LAQSQPGILLIVTVPGVKRSNATLLGTVDGLLPEAAGCQLRWEPYRNENPDTPHFYDERESANYVFPDYPPGPYGRHRGIVRDSKVRRELRLM